MKDRRGTATSANILYGKCLDSLQKMQNEDYLVSRKWGRKDWFLVSHWEHIATQLAIGCS